MWGWSPAPLDTDRALPSRNIAPPHTC